ncbi:hypothetical protein Pcinc_009653 [Petrolisthes cinctipes]|uniref:Uncharacterized protein n=1 Tax=Petrolisthes cinctipes TaxID=88211 RepID=A0AAE1KVA1_PETCI|nr:hypothetical protein Pcinc_009653 [Petrolisthes cinctipes]
MRAEGGWKGIYTLPKLQPSHSSPSNKTRRSTTTVPLSTRLVATKRTLLPSKALQPFTFRTLSVTTMDVKYALVLLATALALVLAQPASHKTSLEAYFDDRTSVEAIIECFLHETMCNSEQAKIRERAMATMRNFGTCPKTMCTDKEKKEMTRAMTLLESKHPDLWNRLIASMFGIDLTARK